MIKRDYYEVLELERSADTQAIKKAYRRLALQYHPDRTNNCSESEEKFKEASEAYEVLSDPQRRQLYDSYGHAGLEGAGFHGINNVEDIFGSMGSIFEEFFGGMGGFGARTGRSGGQRVRAGADLRFDLTVSFVEAAKGIEREISLTRQVRCDTCSGLGQQPGTERRVCQACGGSGSITQQQGFFVMQTACPRCRGQGSFIETPCEDCRGQGRVRSTRKLTVKVPAGVENGMRLVLRGEGEGGENGGPPGDLYVFISVEPHDFFGREGDDLTCEIPITFPQAILGTTITVPTLDGEAELTIPAGTDHGEVLRLKGKGLANVHRHWRTGDQLVRIRITTPKKLSKKQRKLLEEFEKS